MTILLPHAFGLHTPAGGVDELLLYGSSSSTSSTITYPTGGNTSGYLAVLHDTASINPGTSPPTGFTSIIANSVSNPNHQSSYRVLDGTEGTTITGMNGDTSNSKVLLVFYSPSRSIASVSVFDTDFQTTSGDPTSQTCTFGSASTPAIGFGSAYVGNALGAFSTSPPFDGEVSDGARLTVGYIIALSSPSNFDVDKADQGNNNQLSTFYLEVTYA